MKEFKLTGSLRTESGKKIAKKLRKDNCLPAILYGGKENVLLSLVERDLKDLIYTPIVYMIDLKVGKKSYKAIVKEMQFHPITDRVLHVDLLEVSDDKKITVSLPIKLVGASEGAKQGGTLSLTTRKIRANGFPKDLPEIIEVDVTDLGLGKSRLVEDLKFEKFEIIEPKSTVIASVKLTRAAKGAAQAATTSPVDEVKL